MQQALRERDAAVGLAGERGSDEPAAGRVAPDGARRGGATSLGRAVDIAIGIDGGQPHRILAIERARDRKEGVQGRECMCRGIEREQHTVPRNEHLIGIDAGRWGAAGLGHAVECAVRPHRERTVRVVAVEVPAVAVELGERVLDAKARAVEREREQRSRAALDVLVRVPVRSAVAIGSRVGAALPVQAVKSAVDLGERATRSIALAGTERVQDREAPGEAVRGDADLGRWRAAGRQRHDREPVELVLHSCNVSILPCSRHWHRGHSIIITRIAMVFASRVPRRSATFHTATACPRCP